MSTKFFLYATSTLFLFGCGESVSETPQTTMDPMEMMNMGPAPDENGRIELTPCEQATAADLSACAMSIYELKDQGQALEDLRVSVLGRNGLARRRRTRTFIIQSLVTNVKKG